MKPRLSKQVEQLIKRKQSIKLDLGCGPGKQDGGFIGIDTRALPGVDIVHDLEQFPWPLPTSVASHVVISHFWEHLKPWLTLKFMAELHRVCQDGAQVYLSGPYSTEFRFVQDPTHCNPSNEATFLYWDSLEPLWGIYRPPVFHMLGFKLIPVAFSRDFNAVLQVCKPKNGKCPHAKELNKKKLRPRSGKQR